MIKASFSKYPFRLFIVGMIWMTVFPNNTSAQEEMFRDLRVRSFGTTYFYKPPLQGTIGSPLLYDVWFSGHLILKEDTSRFEAAFLYDASQDIMLFTAAGDTHMVAKPLLLDRIEFANMTFVYALETRKVGGQTTISGNFFQVIAGDSVRLLQKTLKHFEENRSISYYMGGSGDGRPRYITTRTYYYQVPGGAAIPLNRSKKALLQLSPQHRTELKSYMKTKRTNPQQLADLAAFFEYLNTLK